jgi:hypothetical protein
MFFLIRMAFWSSVVLVLLPTGGSKPTDVSRSQIGPLEAVSAASATVADMSHFCARQPEACAVGSQAAVALGHRAQAGARMVYDFLNERMETGSIANKATKATPGSKSSQQTLTPADLAPAWRGPRKDPQNPGSA